ncbi:hypothetical protein HL650_08135 [Blautia pseudococcoides]|nr:hypothetical protein HL650_08135 [Blautia pseudococcoides]
MGRPPVREALRILAGAVRKSLEYAGKHGAASQDFTPP